MKRKIAILLALSILIIACFILKSQWNLNTVVRIVDGDTFVVRNIFGKEIKIRPIGMDTPETKHPQKPVECYGPEATQKAIELLAGKLVRLEKDKSQGEKDRYERPLCYIYRKDGLFFNLEMIKLGFARERQVGKRYKYKKEFMEAQYYAQENNLGLWENCSNFTHPQKQISKKMPSDCDCECSFNKYNCSDFKTQKEAQYIFNCCGGVANDIHKLDINHDGIACESLK